MENKHLNLKVEEKNSGSRIDKVLPVHFPDYTRQYFQKLLKEGHITVNNRKVKPRFILNVKDEIKITIPALKPLNLTARNIPIKIIFENNDYIVINKPPGLVTHPGVGNSHIEDSLVNAILYHCKGNLSGISGVMRPGIVHRLDKDTSGLIVIAKNDKSHQDLGSQLKNHQIQKVYVTLLAGHISPPKGSIDAPIGRSNVDRKKMAVVSENKGKNALTHYEVLDYFKTKFPAEPHYSLVKVQIMTGRTHQIRVHFASIGHPVVGDQVYGRDKVNEFFDRKFNLKRQFLHAQKLSFKQPKSKKNVNYEAPLTEDLQKVLAEMKKLSIN